MSERPSRFKIRRLGAGMAVSILVALFADQSRAGTAGIFDATPLTTTDGRQIYEHICQGCHMPNAVGAVGAGRYPALAKNPALASREYMALTLLNGRRNMPAFGTKHAVDFGGSPTSLSDIQIAAVINYVRMHFGNRYGDSITADQVGALDRYQGT